ncbi:TPA: hypothetical protein ACXR7G_002347 [Yersinia enterocolitica]
MKIKLIGSTKDYKSGTNVIYAKSSIDDYLNIIGDNFADFHIQRKRELHNTYKRMKEDIKEGALLPTITLSVKSEFVQEIIGLLNGDNVEDLSDEKKEVIKKSLLIPGRFQILDGLQRTYILKDLKRSQHDFIEGQTVHLEFWLEPDIKYLVYRLIVLNSGQKKMSMRHQVELLFSTIREKIELDIPGLKVMFENEDIKRNNAKEIPFDRIVIGYQCFLLKTPEVKKDNIVAQRLNEDAILDSNEIEIGNDYEGFIKFLGYLVEFDHEIYRIYNSNSSKNWMVEFTVIQAFFAAIGSFTTTIERENRVKSTLDRLLVKLKLSEPDSDPLGLVIFNEVKGGISPKKQNVGYATRRLLNNSFKEYFRNDGEISLAEIWRSESE